MFAGALRNASAIAAYLAETPGKVLLLAAGEEWPDSSLRPAFEDQIACGAIAHFLGCSLSSEASLAHAGYLSCADVLHSALEGCVSGQELTHRGYAADVEWAVQLNAERCVPELRQVQRGGQFVNAFEDVS
ncbi:2-phosphosulfolactate phosphatase [Pseudovibrio denitrificans]|uniref:2-phosphosulfolactate phosphatase n=1 Tax=Pseudovibrio denitrificans TaxID=258256 RepID=UPI001AD938DF|nr:2-phosphosulfolactate phosphatase [Pseudovibrio denitrificans]